MHNNLHKLNLRKFKHVHVLLLTQAEFSFVQWPFSLKLLWAPIVDSIFSKRFGRRKTWLIPTQYLMGMFMLLLSNYVDHWLGKEHEKPNIEMLTALFFALNVLAATQDIVVDGWALTMLKRYLLVLCLSIKLIYVHVNNASAKST